MIKLYHILVNNKIIAVTLACLCTAIIFIACLYPSSGNSTIRIPHFDKLVHLLAFTSFTFCWSCTLRQPSVLKYLVICLAGISVGTLIEFLQDSAITYGRSFELYDIIADALGAMLGIFIHVYIHKLYSRYK